jgi:hypothetical protein
VDKIRLIYGLWKPTQEWRLQHLVPTEVTISRSDWIIIRKRIPYYLWIYGSKINE